MKTTTNNLLIFVMANNGTSYCNGKMVLNMHTHLGLKVIGELVRDKADLNFTQARYFKSRKERWEYLKKKNPALELLEKELM